jgi:putative heme-binding domain-containing protein
MRLLDEAPTQEEQIDVAKTLRHLRTGWTPELRNAFFRWTNRARGYRGGASFATFVQRIRQDALAPLSDEVQRALKPILDEKPPAQPAFVAATKRPVVAEWTLQTLVPLVATGLKDRDYRRGRKMFAAANCFACHRFDNQGGSVGPDLTILAGRFSPRDILESIVDPSKQISDQYGSVQILTTDGKVVAGRIVNLAGDTVRVQTNMMAPSALTGVDRKQIEEIVPSRISMMPTGLLNTLTKTEILDLMAYLLSRGDPQHAMFKSP